MAQEQFIELWTEAYLSYLGAKDVPGSTWVVGGDPRYYFKQAFDRVVSVIASHQVRRIVTGRNGLLTGPAMALLVRRKQALGGILITAPNHNAGPEGYLGFKFVLSDGSAAGDKVMKAINERLLVLSGYFFVNNFIFPLDEVTSYSFKVNGNYTEVTICNAVDMYANYMESIFDFDRLRDFIIGRGEFNRGARFMIDCMNAAGGPFADEIFVERLSCPTDTLVRNKPSEEFNKAEMTPDDKADFITSLKAGQWAAGFALDTVAEQVMVMGPKGFLVTAGDSAAVLAAHLHCLPYFQLRGIRGFARTLSSPPAIDLVAKDENFPIYEVPFAMEYIAKLLQAGLISFFVEKYYGLGSQHLPEKDGIWGILAWLSVLVHMKTPINDIVMNHWKKYGRIFTARLDCLGVSDNDAFFILEAMERKICTHTFFGSKVGDTYHTYTVLEAENFIFYSPLDEEVIRKCGLKIRFECGSRIVCRMSDNNPNTFRIYLEHYSTDSRNFHIDRITMVRQLLSIALQLTNIEKFVGESLTYKIT